MPSRILIAYGLPALPAAVLGLPLLLYLPTFYAVDLGLGFTVVGAVLLLARVADVIADPLIGWASDRFDFGIGRRRSWLLLSLPLVLIGVWFLFRPSSDVTATYLLFGALAVYLGWTLMTIPHQAWGAELTEDYVERNRVMASREIAGLVGVMLAASMPTFLVAFNLTGPDESEAASSLGAIAWFILVLLPLCGAGLFAVVPEPPRVTTHKTGGWRAGLRLLLDNRPFRRLLLSYLFNGIANGLPATLFLLFVTHVLLLPEDVGLFLLVYFGAAIVGMPIWLKLARRHGKHRTWCLAMLFNCLVFAMVPFLSAGDFIAYVAVCLATGIAFGADLVLPASMQADVVDVDTASGGDQRTGLYFSLWAMATKLAQALAVGLAFPLLDAFGFSVMANNSEGALYGLTALYAALPIVFKLAAVTLVWGFPIDAMAQAELRRRIRKG